MTSNNPIRAALLSDPEVQFDANGAPFSRRFADRYHHDDGVGERLHVFVTAQRLAERFAALPSGTHFHIGEIGFGTGLTVHLLAQTFLRHAPPDTRLHITSCDAAPLHDGAWQRLATLRADLGAGYAQLARHAPPALPGWHRRWLHPRVRLSLFHGEATHALAALLASDCGGIDAWCLDGFAPARNPTAWSPALFESIATLCAHAATLASFTAVGAVRRALEGVGFRVERVTGEPFKRHHLRAEWTGEGRLPIRVSRHPVHIVGAGLAGGSLAYALRARGLSVGLSDTHSSAPGGASANPAAALHLRIPREFAPRDHLRLSAFTGALAWFDTLRLDGWQPTGLLHLAIGRDAEALPLFADAMPRIAEWVESDAATAICGVTAPAPGLWMPNSGHADLSVLSRGLRGGSPLDVVESTRLQVPDSAPSDTTTIYCAPDLLQPLGVRTAPGTVTTFAAPAPRCALSGDGYVVPLGRDLIASGGTYDRAGNHDSAERNRRRALLFGALPSSVRGQFQGVRYGTADRLPLIGQLGPEQWVMSAFGSSGLTWAWLGAELIASALCHEPPALDQELATLLAPARFVATTEPAVR